MEVVPNRRLAAIVAVDLAGYSNWSENDEAAAVRAVGDLAAAIEAEARAHGGRVFNTAGDGFMLEFPTVSGALAAAEAIAVQATTQVRVGVHLGEVSVTPDGDLLGHGVNVAARLQAMARPGAVLASDAVKRATQGLDGKRLRPEGRVRLDKMSEKIAVYSLDSRGDGRRGRQRRLAVWWPTSAAVLAVAALATLFWPRAGAHELRVAVPPFQAGSADAASRALSGALAGEVAAALTEREVVTVSRDAAGQPKRGGARLLVEGAVEKSQVGLRVRVSLIDLKTNRSVWTTAFERSAAEADALGDQTATKVADTVDRALRALSHTSGEVDADLLATLLKMLDQQRDGVYEAGRNLDLDRRIVARAPNFALGHAILAMDLASSLSGRPPALAAQMRQESEAEAARALALDPKTGDAYLALQTLLRSEQFAEREAVLGKGLLADPQNAALNNFMGDLMRSVGRVEDGAGFHQRGLLLDPLSPSKTVANIYSLAGVGREGEAEALVDRALRLFPGPAVRGAALYSTILYASPDRALAMLDDPATAKAGVTEAQARIWRGFINGPRRGRGALIRPACGPWCKEFAPTKWS